MAKTIISICRDSVWAGDGRIDADGCIVDCPAILGDSQDASDETYEAIQDAIESGDTSLDHLGSVYTWSICEE